MSFIKGIKQLWEQTTKKEKLFILWKALWILPCLVIMAIAALSVGIFDLSWESAERFWREVV